AKFSISDTNILPAMRSIIRWLVFALLMPMSFRVQSMRRHLSWIFPLSLFLLAPYVFALPPDRSFRQESSRLCWPELCLRITHGNTARSAAGISTPAHMDQ